MATITDAMIWWLFGIAIAVPTVVVTCAVIIIKKELSDGL